MMETVQEQDLGLVFQPQSESGLFVSVDKVLFSKDSYTVDYKAQRDNI